MSPRRSERTIAELAEAFKRDPKSLTPRELLSLRRAMKPPHGPADYAAIKERSRARAAEVSKSGRDIGAPPRRKHPRVWAKCRFNLRLFCETYQRGTYYLPWSDDQLRVIARLEFAALHGGRFALAMPRGSGKTSLCESAGLWSVLYGHCSFGLLIGATGIHGAEMMASLMMALETNERIGEDFAPEVYAIRALDRIAQRGKGQLCGGEHTYIEWTDSRIVMPTVPGSLASGAIIVVTSMTGRIRGIKYTRRDGRSVRPDFALVDDPQTDDTAKSETETADRLAILKGAILKAAGPKRKIACVVPCTVIRRGDLADQILDRKRFPEFQAQRMKMLYAFPTNEKLWNEYRALQTEELRADRDISRATAWYSARRAMCRKSLAAPRDCPKCKRFAECMDAGAVVGWEHLYDPDEASAVQHAMNLRFEDEPSFWAECQNEPKDAKVQESRLTADQIARKFNGLPRGLVPAGANRLTAFVDVQGEVLFYVVIAWRDDFTGWIVDYGAFPDQGRDHFALRAAPRPLAKAFPGAGLEGRIYAGLDKLAEQLLGREWRSDTGPGLRIERCLVDANWGQMTDVVYQFCRQSRFAAMLLPSHGKGVGASSKPWHEYAQRPGERLGHHWTIPSGGGTARVARHAVIDTNYWKSFVHERLAVAQGDPSCLSLWGDGPHYHRLFAEHLTAEYPTRVSGRGRSLDEWKPSPAHPDNHWLDGVVGCCVAASILGVGMPEHRAAPKRKRVSFAEQRRAARERRRSA